MSKVKVERIPYGGWSNCVRIANGTVDLVITADVGPRIIRYGFTGQNNELCEIRSTMGMIGSDEWRIYGGHRLWHSPESRHRTYEPDNQPVKWEGIENGVRTMQRVEQRTGIRKEMDISLPGTSGGVRIIHRLHNDGAWPIELSVWSITAMAPGGKEVIPQNRSETGLLPNRTFSLWPYTRMDDPRIYWGNKYIILGQDSSLKHPFKIGISNEGGWAGYFNNNHLFVKKYEHAAGERYPDFGSSYETYTNDLMLEMESLSPLLSLKPGAYAEHTEEWDLFDNIPCPPNEESHMERILADRIRR